MNDLRYALRQFARNPGFAFVAVVTLALGIGANTAIFSVVNAVVLRPLPYPEPDRLVTLWERNPRRGVEQDRVSGPNFLDWRAQSSSFVSMSVSPGWEGSGEVNLVRRDGVLKLKCAAVSASYFPTLGVLPLLGRTFVPDEDRKDGNRVVVLSHGLWRRLFGGATNIIGQTLTLDSYGRRDCTVVGVMPPRFGVPADCELWLPLGWLGVTLEERRSAHWHNVLARLKPGVTLERAEVELNTIQARLARQYPEAMIGTEVAVVPLLKQALGRNLHRALLVLWGVVIGVLLIACVNVANLQLARAASRQREIAVRTTLGASRARIFRQLLVESLMLALLGGGLGVGLGWLALKVFIAASPGYVPRLAEVSLDGSALGFTLLVALVAGVLFGLAPAWQFSRPDSIAALKDADRGGSAGVRSSRMRHLLVVSEVALSLILLVAAGLLLRSFSQLAFMDRGFQPEHLVTAELDYSVSGYTTWIEPTATRPQVTLRLLMERLRQRPGVVAVGAAHHLPRHRGGPPNERILIAGRPVRAVEEMPVTGFNAVSPDFFRALGTPILRGRDFGEFDHYEAPQVVLINVTFARTYFSGQNPVGQRIAVPHRQNRLQPESPWYTNHSPWREIVGVVADIKNLSMQPDPVPEVYVPYWQWPMQSPTLVVRTAGDPVPFMTVLRSEVKATIPNLPQPVVRSMDDLLMETVALPRFQAGLVSLFGLLALGLAALGLYGVLAYAVSQRRREIGVRMAIGARPQDVLMLVLRQGLALAAVGMVAGWIGAFASMRVLRAILFELSPTDPVTFILIPAVLGAVVFLACWLPARRAARVDPMAALRNE